MSRKITRILSDLHYGDDVSWLHTLSALEPLLEGVDHLIVNGDALDTQVTDEGPILMAEVKDFFKSRVPETTFITGNHDPDISDTHELSLVGGRVWLTHGDVFFPEMVPWSRKLPEIRRRLELASRDIPLAMRSQIETRLRLHRIISKKLPPDHNPHAHGRWHVLARFIRVVFPPQRSFALMKMWMETPRLAAHLAQAQRPDARFVLMGHTHFHGSWLQSNRRVIINTGSFCPPRGGQFAEITGDRLRVHRILRRSGSFLPGPIIAEFPLAEDPVSAVVP